MVDDLPGDSSGNEQDPGSPSRSPASINPHPPRRRPRRLRPVEEYVSGILSGDRVTLSQAITLIESTRPEHQELARTIVDRCLPHAGDSIRVGITGVPGVGKSTLIESLGTRLTSSGRRLAVLAIDPTSERTRGSILGDKTRMPGLAADPNAFIRPSPTSGSLGGVGWKTRETILLCEAAGFDTVFVETVGVGQSEVTVHSMVDFFLLLALAGAGDELQGIKRGVIEMADSIAVTKADGDNAVRAQEARNAYRRALSLFPPPSSGWQPRVLTCSARTGAGLDEIWETVQAYVHHTQGNGFFDRHRREQARFWMYQVIEHRLREAFFSCSSVREALPALERQVTDGTLSPFVAAEQLLELYQTRTRDR